MKRYSTLFHDDSDTVAGLIHGARAVRLRGFSEQHLQPAQWTGPALAHVSVRSSAAEVADQVARKKSQARIAWLAAWLLSLFGVCGITLAVASRF